MSGRNKPCPCSSGKKYKFCCLKADRVARRQAFLEKAVRQLSCGCCTNGCICGNHQDVPRGKPAHKCALHQRRSKLLLGEKPFQAPTLSDEEAAHAHTHEWVYNLGTTSWECACGATQPVGAFVHAADEGPGMPLEGDLG